MSQDDSSLPPQAQTAGPIQLAAWTQALELLDGLLELAPEQRDRELSSSDVSPEVRDLVLRLLIAHDRAAGPLEKMPEREASAIHHALTGRRLGRWRLQQQIGSGGMAAVYRAVSMEAPLGQEAALKVLTLGALAAGGRERFLREQQLLSRMSHPFIVPLYDAGIADDGTLWLALALVDGERIDEWCLQRQLGLEQRIDLVLKVAQALSYAHRNLVVHRDIKPSNVLVDDEGHVRLLDFGLARLTDELATERTGTAMLALTPEYAAPEQFAGAPPSTAMDVYGLGALAYRLLTGQPPRRSADAAIARTLPPSRMVKQDAQMPDADRRLLAKRLRCDLDTIAMKALAHVPERRYASIDALADDLRRWRERRPIEAHAPSAWYSAGKFVLRNKSIVAAGVTVVLLLAVGLALVLWQADRARREAARATAVRNFVQTLFDPVREGLAEDRMPSIPELVAVGVRRLEATPGLGDAERIDLLNMFSRLHESIGDLPRAAALSEDAVKRARAKLDPDDPLALEALVTHGYIATRLERFAEARLYLEEARERMQRTQIHGEALINLLDAQAILENSEGATERVLQLAQQALAERVATWGPSDSRTTIGYDKLGYALEGAARYKEAATVWHKGYLLKFQQGGPESIDLARMLHGEASSLWRAGHWAAARKLFNQTSGILSRVGGKPQYIHVVHANKLCTLEGALANAQAQTQRCREAEQVSRAAYTDNHQMYADYLVAYASGLIEAGNLEEARAALLRASPMFQNNRNDALRRGRLNSELAEIDLLGHKPGPALALLETATSDLRSRAYWILPAIADARQLLACTQVQPPACPARLEEKVQAEAARRAPDAHPQMLEVDTILARIALNRGDTENAQARLSAAIARARRELRADHPRILEARLWRAAAAALRGDCVAAERERAEVDALQRIAYPNGYPFLTDPHASVRAICSGEGRFKTSPLR